MHRSCVLLLALALSTALARGADGGIPRGAAPLVEDPAGAGHEADSSGASENGAGEKSRETDETLLHLDEDATSHSPLVLRWELAPGTKQGTFVFRPHDRNYVLPVRYSTNPNDQPDSPRTGSPPGQDFDHAEAKFQLSFKMKMWEGVFGEAGDLWFAYTQQSHWQVYNASISRSFRETNYQPEVMLAFSTDYSLLGLRGRLLNFGLVHQSNGQSDPLSRSWNRAYVQVGLERGRFTLLLRPWLRFAEDSASDDNSDIGEFLGYGDLEAVYKHDRHTISMEARPNFSHSLKGSVQLDYSFGGVGQMKGYVQVFSGYGESLVDYNHRQSAIGVGLLLTDKL